MQRATVNVYGLVEIFSTVGIVITICRMLPAINIIDYLGRRSLGLYFLSGAIPNIYAVLVSKLGINLTFGLYILIGLISFMLACVIASLMYKYIPFVFDFSKIELGKYSGSSLTR